MATERRRKFSSTKFHISAAILPPAAFVAVPDVSVPKCIEDAPLMGALVNSTAISRMFGSPQPKIDENQEQEDSVLDYEQMNDNGYLTIPFGELSPDKMPNEFIDEVDEEQKEENSFYQTSNEETNKNSSSLFTPVLKETLLARGLYHSEEEIEEDSILPLIQEMQNNNFESSQQERNEEYDQEMEQNHIYRSREQHLKEEIINLRNIVHRLNVELSKYQAKYCSADILDQCQNLEGLPTQGPIPSWLISTKYLSPLVMEYGMQIEKLEANIAFYKKEFESTSKHCMELITENENLHKKMEKLTSGSGHLLERSVMDQHVDLLTAENLILLEQVKREKTKNQEVDLNHQKQMKELKDEIHAKSEKCLSLETQILQELQKNQELKNILETLELENKSKISLEDHDNIVALLKKKHKESLSENEKMKKDLLGKLESCYEEKETFLNIQTQCKDKIERMHSTIKSLKAKTKDDEKINRKLIEALKVTQNMEYLSQEQMERFRLNEEVVEKILEKHTKSAENHKQMKNKLKVYKKKLSEEVLCKKEALNDLRQEFEIQIQQLCSTLKHKEHLLEISEADKIEMENDMEVLWQAAESENQVMRKILKRISCQCQNKSLLCGDC